MSTAASSVEPIEALRAEFGGCRVLLVEDSDIFATVLGALLEEAGLIVDQAEHGEQALARMADEAYSAVLMDVEMPVMDGIEATRRIRASGGAAAEVPIVMVTAHAMLGDRDRYLAAGANDYIAKPIKPDQLRETLRRILCPCGKCFNAATCAASPCVP